MGIISGTIKDKVDELFEKGLEPMEIVDYLGISSGILTPRERKGVRNRIQVLKSRERKAEMLANPPVPDAPQLDEALDDAEVETEQTEEDTDQIVKDILLSEKSNDIKVVMLIALD